MGTAAVCSAIAGVSTGATVAVGTGVLKNAANRLSGVGTGVGMAVGGAVGVDALTVPSASGVCVAKRFPVAVGEASKAFSRCSFSHCTS